MKDIGVKMSGGKSNDGRQYFDFYPTPKEVTIALCEYFEIKNKKVLEPACGDGSMSIVLENYGNDVALVIFVKNPMAFMESQKQII